MSNGATTVWSDDDEKNVNLLLAKYKGDPNKALKRFFESAGGTDYAAARGLSVRFSAPFGLTEVEFMKRYRRWRRGKPLS